MLLFGISEVGIDLSLRLWFLLCYETLAPDHWHSYYWMAIFGCHVWD